MRAVFVLLLGLIASLAFAVLVSAHGLRAERRARDAEHQLVALRAAAAAVPTTVPAPAATAPSTAATWTLSEEALARLRARGLADPVRDLRADLLRHPEVVPFPGPDGQPLRIRPRDITVLSGRWVYARFGDARMGGDCVLAYAVARGGKITWWRLDAKLSPGAAARVAARS